MITKERLEELIKQGATIYYNNTVSVQDKKLDKTYQVDNGYLWRKIKNGAIKSCGYPLENLFETEEDARWELEMTATRTETLKLPKWEDAQIEKFSFTYLIDVEGLHLYINIYKFTNKFNISCHHGCHFGDYSYEKTFDLRDKEQYETACKLCLRLFRGEEV